MEGWSRRELVRLVGLAALAGNGEAMGPAAARPGRVGVARFPEPARGRPLTDVTTRATLERALALSRGKTPAAYQEGLERLLKEWAAAPR